MKQRKRGPKPKYAYTAKTILDQWASKYNSTVTWLSKLNGSKQLRALDLFRFCDWANKNPDELLAMKTDFTNVDVEKLLDRFVLEAPIPESMRWRSSIAVKSFFRCNYRAIQVESGKIEYTQKKPQRYPNKIQRQELFKACYNPRDRALIMVACCSAIALESMSRLQWYHLEENWRRQEIPHISLPSEVLKGHGKGKYKGVRQETFLTPECKRELVKYREYMTKEHSYKWKDSDHVFLNLESPYDPMTYGGLGNTILTISQRAEVPFSIHDGRRIVETSLENVGTPRNWIQKCRGRKVRGEDAPYSKPAIEQLRKKYQEALPELEFLQAEGEPKTTEIIALQNQMEQKLEENMKAVELAMEEDRKTKALVDVLLAKLAKFEEKEREKT